MGVRQLSKIPGPPVHKIAIAQLLILLAASVAFCALDEVAAYSLAFGGLVAVLPQAYFAARVFSWRGASLANAKSIFRGEMGKYILSAAGFALIFALVEPIYAPAVFFGFCVMVVIQTIGAWLLLTGKRK